MKKLRVNIVFFVALMIVSMFLCPSTLASARYGYASKYSASDIIYSEIAYTPSNINYNCYGYAIGTNQNVDPGYYSNRSLSMNISSITQSVIADLTALGYSNARTVSSSYSLQPGELMLAVAVGFMYQTAQVRNLGFTPQGEGYTYHFWRKDVNGGRWYHKYGRLSTIMKLKSGYTPSNIAITDEYFDGSGNASPAAHTMTSPSIRYIVYRSNLSPNTVPSRPR